MNYGIGNVKGKSSGGGGIPVITLEASQMVDSTHIQFTEEQYNTIVNNGAFYLDILGSQQLLMTCVNASNLADIQCYNISQTGSGLQLATIDLNKTTYIGVLGISPYPQAKQLYQHNIQLNGTLINTTSTITLMFTIISSSNLPFVKSNDYVSGTNQNLNQWLKDNHFTLGIKYFNANGATSNNSFAIGIATSGDNYFYTHYGSNNSPSQLVNTTLIDDVITI